MFYINIHARGILKWSVTIVLGIEIKITNKKFLENNNLKFVKSKGIEEFFMRICLSFIICYTIAIVSWQIYKSFKKN